MKEYICKEEFREFFFSPESGTEEVISGLIMKHNLDYLHDVNEEDVNSFAKDLIFAFLNVLDTEEVVTKADICREIIANIENEVKATQVDYEEAMYRILEYIETDNEYYAEMEQENAS